MIKKILATASLVTLSLVFAGTTFAASVDISGNGWWSHNKVKKTTKVSSTTIQTNKSVFKNYVGGETGTGGVKASKNTGGSVTVSTGDSTSDVNVSNTANINTAVGTEDACCPCANESSDISITDNGANSHNSIKIKHVCNTATVQENDAYIKNKVWVGTSTGGVSTSKNTGGDVEVTTGEANSSVTITNTANSNTIGGSL